MFTYVCVVDLLLQFLPPNFWLHPPLSVSCLQIAIAIIRKQPGNNQETDINACAHADVLHTNSKFL